MASIVYTVQTDDGVTVNVTHTINISDGDLARIFNAFVSQQKFVQEDSNPITKSWVMQNMLRARALVSEFEGGNPNQIAFTIT